MTIQQGEQLLAPFIEAAKKDKDPFILVHFSRQDDYYQGRDCGMDMGDALLVIRQLIKAFDINTDALANMQPA